MPRTADEHHRSTLLDRIVDYVTEHGVAGLSLRPLAKAVGSSPRVLLYYFRSKEDLVVDAIARARERQRGMFETIRAKRGADPGEVCRVLWGAMSAPKAEPAFRLFFEVYGLALQQPERYKSFLRSAVADWLTYLEDAYKNVGYSRRYARSLATAVIAGYRGFMLDLCATHERARINAAFEVWMRGLDASAKDRRSYRSPAPR